MIVLNSEMAIELVLWALLAFSVLSCAFAVVCVILYRRLVVVKRVLRNSQVSLSPEKIAMSPAARKMASSNGIMGLSRITGSVSLKSSTPNTAESRILVKIPAPIKQRVAMAFLAIVQVYKRLKYYVNQSRAEPSG